MTAQAPPAPPIAIRLEDHVPVLVIPSEPTFEELRAWLREALPARIAEIGGRAGRLDLGERDLQLFDLRRLLHVLRDDFAVEITGLYVRPEAIQRFAERELKLKLFPVEATDEPTEVVRRVLEELIPAEIDEEAVSAPPAEEERGPEVVADEVPAPDGAPDAAPRPEIARLPAPEPRSDPGRRTLSVHRTLRSGSSVRFDGDVVVFGDVNPGAQVIASGNVVVLGALKGMAHAGATGAEDAFILAFELRPTQLRIGRKIAIPPDSGARPSESEYARIVDDQIVIDPYRLRNARPKE